MASIRDIAKETGLSIGTISRYINKSGYVSKESAEKIKIAIKELDYVPNEHARAVFKNKSKLIGILLPSLSNPFFAEMTMHLEREAQTKGYGVILFTTDDNVEKEKQAFKLLKGYRVQGIITTRTQLKEEISKTKIPIISFETEVNDDVITVSSDNYEGGRIAFNHLQNRGCKKILHIKGPSRFDATESRCKGFLDEAKNKNVKVDIIQFDSDFNLEYSLEKMIRNYDITQYDGIFAFNDIAAVLIIGYLLEKNIKIPEDIKIIGFDNSYMGDLIYPKLTTIDQPVDKISSKCMELLIDIIEGKDLPKKHFLEPVKLIQRKST
ncbi:MAG: LacI family DNA-binding transcriptional regulator [Miniphocaeibacter sp.]|uniref:LacI family DNA-binding transcriptional regulator n=1 Tax=Miniphocaeibacter sp. TaxID=3100973 RepID=UPI00184D1614|nr:LacI family transcriptional regulator [Gallicola sp.]